MIKFVVVNENIFGYVDPLQPLEAGVLASSTIRGASHHWMDGPYPLPADGSGVRPATLADFKSFNISTGGYDEDPSYDMPTV